MKTVSELFNNTFFRIPDYQRGYAWKKEKQLPETWDDIEEILDTENNGFQPHYMGTLFVERMKRNDIPEPERWAADGAVFYNVVDGQQRLTTISILLYALLSLEKNSYMNRTIDDLKKLYLYETNATGKSRVYHFTYSGKENYYLQYQIFCDETLVSQVWTESAYDKNLREAKDFFYEKINGMSYEDRNMIFRKITTALYFDVHEIEEGLDVQSVFETMNNRGKPLTVLEKLKNRLMYLTEKLNNCETSDKIHLRDNIRTAWGCIYTELARNPNKVLDEDDFLSAHLSLCRKPSDYVFSEKQTEEKVFKMFCNRAERYRLNESEGMSPQEPGVDFEKIDRYVKDLSTFVSWWYQVNNTDNLLINKIYLLYSGKEIKIYLCALLRALDIVKQPCDNDLRMVEKILFRNATPGVGVRDPRTFATLARELYCDPQKLEGIRATLKEELSGPINVDAVVGGFSHLLGSYVNNPVGYYRWNALKYFLFEYENELYCKKYNQDTEKMLFKNYADTQIEHILPKDETPFWINEVKDFSSNFSTDDSRKLAIRVLKNTLGNLTILKDKKNTSVSKNPWSDDPTRRLTGKKTRYATGSFSEIELSKIEHWNKKTIYDRGKKLLDYLFIKLDASGTILSEDQYKKALFYSVELFDTGFMINHEHINN